MSYQFFLSRNFYYNIREGDRQYFSWPISGRQAYLDTDGNWFSIDSEFHLSYYTGPNTGK